ncbi:MAG TPA: hypothetical protein VNV43_13840 [Candidatus Acidoferrales bacterium]|nr:hypothetical protein [Candidatus Acidoferrales bacterium]
MKRIIGLLDEWMNGWARRFAARFLINSLVPIPINPKQLYGPRRTRE